ncbi:MAG: Rieske 2Fe-2S domain-containing protein [Bacteroidota bacterium]
MAHCRLPSRRRFMRQSATVGLVWLAGNSLAGCGIFDDPEMRVCRLDELEAQRSMTSRFNGKKIFLTYLEEELVIFSLICRHKKCTVKYVPDEEIFACPCHEGMYDKEGEVIDGPPPAPLHRFQYEIRDGEIWVLNKFAV